MSDSKENNKENQVEINQLEDWEENYQAYLKSLPWYKRLWQEIWPVPQRYAFWRWPAYWADRRWHVRNFKHAWRRATRGFSKEDTWSLDSYLCWWMPNALAVLRDNMHGCGALYNEKGKEIKWTDVDKGCEIRVELLNQMIAGFQAYQKIIDWEITPRTPEYDKVLATGKKGLSLFAYNFLGLWD